MNIPFEFNEKNHTYTHIHSGLMVPGCTTVTGYLPKDWAMPWVAKENCQYALDKVGPLLDAATICTNTLKEQVLAAILESKGAFRRKSDKAAESGTIAHDWIDEYIQLVLKHGRDIQHIVAFPQDEPAANSVRLFLEWEAKAKPIWKRSEVVVGSEVHMVAGKYDWNAEFKEYGNVLGDNKTSAGIYLEQYVQVNGGYRMMADECFPDEKIDNTMILWIPKTGDDFEARIVPSKYEHDRELFLCLLNMHRCLNRLKEHDTKPFYKKKPKEKAVRIGDVPPEPLFKD